MAVIEITELFDREGSMDLQWLRTYKRRFQVVTDTASDGPVAIRNALSGVFGIYPGNYYHNSTILAWHPTDPLIVYGTPDAPQNQTENDAQCYVNSIIPRCVTVDGKQWEVDVTYGPYDPRLNSQDPINNRAEHKWYFEDGEEIVDQDINGADILNAAFDPYDPPVTRPISNIILTIARNEATFDIGIASQYKNKLNLQPFYGADPGKAKMANINAEDTWSPQVSTNQGVYWRVNYEIHFRLDDTGWGKKLRNAGYRQIVSGQRQSILVGGLPISDPLPLDDNGKLLPQNQPIIYDTWDIIESIDFSPLQLEPTP